MLADRIMRALGIGPDRPIHTPIQPADPLPAAMPARVVGVVLKGRIRGDVMADHRAGLEAAAIAAKHRLPVEVVVATLARETAAVARHQEKQAAAEAEVEVEIRRRRRSAGRVL